MIDCLVADLTTLRRHARHRLASLDLPRLSALTNLVTAFVDRRRNLDVLSDRHQVIGSLAHRAACDARRLVDVSVDLANFRRCIALLAAARRYDLEVVSGVGIVAGLQVRLDRYARRLRVW